MLLSFFIRAGAIYVAAVALVQPYLLGLRSTVLYSAFAVVERSFIAAVGLANYPLQGDVLFRVLLSILGATIWLGLDRRRRHEADLARAFLVETRFILAAALLSLGLAKVLHVQIPWPSPADWIRPFREMPPPYYATVWTGASGLHETVLGLVELTAGASLLFRASATFGALIGLGALGNAVMVAIAFEPVRYGGYWPILELAAMALLLVAVDIRRVVALLAFEQVPSEPVDQSYRWSLGWARRVEAFGKPIFLVALALANVSSVIRAYDATHRSPLFGVYEVLAFTVDGKPVPVDRGGEGWRLVAIDDCQRFAVRTIDDRQIETAFLLEGARAWNRHRRCREAERASAGSLTLVPPDSITPGLIQPGPAATLRYSAQLPMLTLEGMFGAGTIAARLRRIPDSLFKVTRYPAQ